MNTIYSDNIIIAKFMGESIRASKNIGAIKDYHISWDILMPVIAKIDALENKDTKSAYYYVEKYLSMRSLKWTHNACIKFIISYNKSNSNK